MGELPIQEHRHDSLKNNPLSQISGYSPKVIVFLAILHQEK
jgi:hypothetical protein